MKNLIKKIFYKFKFLMPLLFIYRKLKLLFYSYLKLPKFVKVLNNNEIIANFDTRNFGVANFCKFNKVIGDILEYEPEQTKSFIEIAKKSKIVFDVGSQIGYYAIIAAKSGVQKVIAIDVDKEFIDIAKKEAILNNIEDKIEFYQIAIGSDGDFVEIENYNGISRAKSASLDSLCKKINLWPDFLKIDIEGFELEAFENGEEFLNKTPIILLAFHPDFIKLRNKDPRLVIRLLLDKNYILKPLNRDLKEITEKNIDEILNYETIDFICYPKL